MHSSETMTIWRNAHLIRRAQVLHKKVVRRSKSAIHDTLKNATKTQPQMKSFFVSSKTMDLSINGLTVEVQLCQNHTFSLPTDEINDQGGKKTLAILIKVFNPEITRAVTLFVCFRYLLIVFNCKWFNLVNTIISDHFKCLDELCHRTAITELFWLVSTYIFFFVWLIDTHIA